MQALKIAMLELQKLNTTVLQTEAATFLRKVSKLFSVHMIHSYMF